ncbi:MAG: hypothetical protein K2X76_00160 [Sphingomonas sp.]|nr:hypothetical protein [Sphingomonas sp.]
MRAVPKIGILLAALGLPLPAHAAESSNISINLSGTVPVICRAELDSSVVPVAEGRFVLGSMSEFCNNATGFVVVARYGSFGSEGVTLFVDGEEKALTASGEIELLRRDRPSIGVHQLEMQTINTSNPSVNLYIEVRPR